MIGKQIAQIWNGTIDEGARHHHQEGVHASWMMSCRGKCLVYHTQKDGNISTTHKKKSLDRTGRDGGAVNVPVAQASKSSPHSFRRPYLAHFCSALFSPFFAVSPSRRQESGKWHQKTMGLRNGPKRRQKSGRRRSFKE